MPIRNRSRGKAAAEPLVKLSIVLPRSLSERLDIMLLDPTRGRIAYGARSHLIERLLREYLSKLQPAPIDNSPDEC